jgi:dTDP-4-amino-4,6-dideoxygalactose transaminase
LASGTIAAGANATLALTISLSAMGARPGKFCLMPAWTFAASAHAAIAAGLKPYLLDVDPKTWTFSPASVISAVERLGRGRVGAVMPVAPFGAPIDSRGWDAFYEQTRIPVVIDAAAGFDLLQATKVLGAGEGGFVVSRDASVIAEVQRRANFGFWGAREASVVATNAKMSEYSAAVALASLDAWPETRACWIAVAQAYRHALTACPGVSAMPRFGDFATTTCVVRLDPNLVDATRISLQLGDLGIATRRWWGRGLQAETAFARAARDDLPVTEMLGAETIGLPCSVDLGRGDITRICKALTHLLQPETQLLLRERA